jgi:nitrogen regulatory protein PII
MTLRSNIPLFPEKGAGISAGRLSINYWEVNVMKMFIIVYSWAFDNIVIDMITKSGLRAYTKWTKVLGCGTETEPKMGSQFWPAENDVLTIVVNNEDAAKVKEIVLTLRKENPRAGVRCFIVPVEEMI